MAAITRLAYPSWIFFYRIVIVASRENWPPIKYTLNHRTCCENNTRRGMLGNVEGRYKYFYFARFESMYIRDSRCKMKYIYIGIIYGVCSLTYDARVER